MITLYSFGKNFGLADPSPFVLKVDAYLRMANIDFKTKAGANNLQKSPKNKLPFIRDGDKIIADSAFIFDYLEKNYSVTLDQHLSEQQKATAHLTVRALEESVYWCVVHSRWVDDNTWPTVKQAFFNDMPVPIKWIVPKVARKSVVSSLYKQGIGRHTDKEILSIAKKNLESISVLLGDKPYFFGDQISSIDAVLYAFLAQVTIIELDTPLNQLARSFTNLHRYCERIHKEFY